MAAKIEWSAADYAARDELARIIDDSGIAYRVIAERMGGYVSHVRIGCIRNGLKAPVRISEFLGICDVCGADPVETLRRIIREAQRIQSAHDSPASANTVDLSDDEARIAETKRILAEDPMSLAAYEDDHKFDPDPDSIA